LPAGFDKAKPAAFMVFQDGVIYQAPVVFDNLIAKGDIPPMVGVFIKPGVVPAANENALPRFNRSFEYDSVTPTYSKFLIEEFLPAVEAEHGIRFSTNPNEAAIAGNSSGGICAFMVAWHRPDRFRRVFTGVGTYVGIHGADQLPVWVRKFEPKPIRVFLQSGTGDNNLYCGDWWMANQMMERSLSWAGYEVKHAWGEGGHNQKHASQVFPEAMRWLWREWKTVMEVKANVKGESKWKGYEVVGDGEWEVVNTERLSSQTLSICSDIEGTIFVGRASPGAILKLSPSGEGTVFCQCLGVPRHLCAGPDGTIICWISARESNQGGLWRHWPDGTVSPYGERKPSDGKSVIVPGHGLAINHRGDAFFMGNMFGIVEPVLRLSVEKGIVEKIGSAEGPIFCLSADQTHLFSLDSSGRISSQLIEGSARSVQPGYYQLERGFFERSDVNSMCVDTNGWLYVATTLGIQVCDQAGRVNFIIPTPQQPDDICFGGKDLSELFITCGDTVYKRVTKAKGVVSGQMAPIKPVPPKL
jgi:enterochelin esterase-like enzyme